MATVYHYFNEIFYNTNLVFISLIFFGSLIMIYIVTNNLIATRAKLRKMRNFKTAERTNIQVQYKRDLILFSVLFFEIILKLLAMINVAYLNSVVQGARSKNHSTILQISANCSIVEGTAIARLYTRGYQYCILISSFQACSLFVLFLLCYLAWFLIKVYREQEMKIKQHAYLAFSVIKSLAIILLVPFPITYLLSEIVYLLTFTIDFIFLVYLLRVLYKLIKKQHLHLVWHGGEEDIDQQIKAKRNIHIFRLFSIILITSYAFEVIGQNSEGIIVSLLGSILENPCWFHSIYGITYNIPFSKHAFEMSGIIAVYVQFMLGTCFNIGLLTSYLVYCFQEIKKRVKSRRVYRYHVERLTSTSESLLSHS